MEIPLLRGEIGVLLFTKKIADYLTSENGKNGRKKTQRWPDNISLLEN